MKILFDHQCFANQDYGGISRYFVNLMNELKSLQNTESELALNYSNNFYLKELSENSSKTFFPNNNFRGKKLSLHLINKHNSIKKIKADEFDVFHPTYYNPYFINYLNKKPFIVTVYDMTHELFPDIIHWMDKTVEHKKLLVEKAKIVIAISENTKQDLIRLLNVPEEKIKVVHLASSLNNELVTNNHSLNLPEKNILYVGSRNYYKNFHVFLNAAEEILKSSNDLFLVCAGGGNFTNQEVELFKKKNISQKVLHKPADDFSLSILYSKALVFVFPSLYEGFGIPVLEAMNCDCPLALSNTSSLPEIGGDAALYFDPTDANSIKLQIDKIISDSTLRNKLIEKGRKQRANFSWQKTALETKNIYEQIL